jgi:hypothetical protein
MRIPRPGLLPLVGVFAAVLAAAPLLAEPPKVPPSPAVVKPAGKLSPVSVPVVRADLLTKEAFKKLPDDTLLEIGGRKIRKADFVAEFKKRAGAKKAGGGAGRPSGLEAMKARLAEKQQAGVAVSAAEVQKRFAEIAGGDGK